MVAGVKLGNRYLVDRLPVAHTGMGEVWFARDIQLDRRVAIKLVNSTHRSDVELLRRFKREAKLMARMDHPGVPTIFDIDVHEGRMYIVLQKVAGVTLRDLVVEDELLPVNWIAAIGAQVSAVLMAAHEISLIHRDIKPSNLMLDSNGAVKVLDFGLATALGDNRYSRITYTGQSLGTPGYMAPEQIRGDEITHRADLYGLGGTLFELLTGRPPFEPTTLGTFTLQERQLTHSAPAPRQFRPDIPDGIEELVLAMLEQNPEDRPASAADVYAVLVL